MGYNNYQQNNYQRRSYQNQGGYGNNNQQPPEPIPVKSPQEFIKDRLNLFLMFLNEAETMGIKVDELMTSGALGGWVTSYLLQKEKGR